MIGAEQCAIPTKVPKPRLPVGEALYQAALDHARAQQYDDARVAFEDLLSQYPEHDKAWISYGQMQKRRFWGIGPSLSYSACRQVLERGLDANPSAASIVQALGLLELQQGDQQSAVQLLERCVRLNPKLSPVLEWKAVREGRKQQ